MTKDSFDEIFKQFSNEDDYGSKTFIENFSKTLSSDFDKLYTEKTVLGVDVYKYSKMDIKAQTVIPYVLSQIYNQAVETCLRNESLFFVNTSRDWFDTNYIDTGDGFFQIFETPLQALIFSIHYQSIISVFNTGLFIPLYLMALNAPLTTRYSITTDSIMEYEGRYYGSAIINNARIISCDSLNRLLIDNSTFEWFMMNINGIETLQALTINDFHKINENLYAENGTSIIIRSNDSIKAILKTDIQQIESIDVKNDLYKIFSLHMQVLLHTKFNIGLTKLVVSIGNLNTGGLNKEI